MNDPFGGAEQKGDAAPTRARVLADVVNRLMQNIILRCAKEDGIRDYFSVGVIGYGDRVQALIEQDGEGKYRKYLIPVSHLAERPLRMEERFEKENGGAESGRRVKYPVWFDPRAKNGTPMCQALDFVLEIMKEWIEAHPRSFPPIVLNVTDGEATDGDPLRFARELRSYATADGEVLLFNVHLSGSTEPPVEFPDTIEGLPDDYARQLFQMSSNLPFPMRAAAEREGFTVNRETRGFVFNADPAALIRFLEIGTRPSNLR